MLTSVLVSDIKGIFTLVLPLIPNSTTPYYVKDIEGLDPVNADISTSTYARHDGGLLQNTRTGTRSMVLTIGYRPDHSANQTIQFLRRNLYSYFPPKESVGFHFRNNEGKTYELFGVVEDIQAQVFDKDPEVKVTIVSPFPHFSSINPVVLSGMNNTRIPSLYFGSTKTGFLFEMFFTRSVSILTISNDVDEPMIIKNSFVNGDTLRVSTGRGDKYIRLVRGGETSNILDSLTDGYMNMGVDPRVETIRATCSGAADIPYRISYWPKFVGI